MLALLTVFGKLFLQAQYKMKAKRILALVTLVLIIVAIWMINNKPNKQKSLKNNVTLDKN